MTDFSASCARCIRRIAFIFDLYIAPLWEQLALSRVPALMVVAALVLAFYVPQIGELFFLLDSDTEKQWWNVVFALICTLYLSFAVWYSARFLFYFRYPSRPRVSGTHDRSSAHSSVRRVLVEWWPRLFGMLMSLLIGVACFVNGKGIGSYLLCAAFFAEAAIVVWVSYKRPSLVRAYNSALARVAPGASNKFRIHWERSSFDNQYRYFSDASLFGRRFLVSGAVLGLGLSLAAWGYPSAFTTVGPIATIELGAATFTLFSTLLVFFGDRHCVPIFTLIGIFLLAVRVAQWDTNHKVTVLSANDPATNVQPSPLPRRTIENFTERAKGSNKIFLVSTEGGGIRATAWTLVVLSKIEQAIAERDRTRHFQDVLLAGSGVSGGSVGLAAYSAIFMSPDTRDKFDSATKLRIAQTFATQDYLGATLPSMLFLDTFQFALPFRSPANDRGAALERAWEAGLQKAIRDQSPAPRDLKQSPFRSPWRALSGAMPDSPVWFLNSTVVGSGQRFIQQPLDFGAQFETWFHGALNGIEWLDEYTPLSAVAHNSARFTYISPPGTLTHRVGEHTESLQLVDGGYYEDSGAETLLEIYRGLLGAEVQPHNVFVIHISNSPNTEPLLLDATKSEDSQDRCTPPEDQTRTKRAGEVEAPVLALLDTMDGRALAARQRLRDVVKSSSDISHFFHFRLCQSSHLPLGWTLSKSAWSDMLTQIGDRDAGANAATAIGQFNANQIKRIVDEVVSTPKGGSP